MTDKQMDARNVEVALIGYQRGDVVRLRVPLRRMPGGNGPLPFYRGDAVAVVDGLDAREIVSLRLIRDTAGHALYGFALALVGELEITDKPRRRCRMPDGWNERDRYWTARCEARIRS